MLETWITTLITFLLGYFIGSNKISKESFGESTDFLKKSITDNLDNRVGSIKRPTANDLFIKKNPQLKAEEDAMRDTFKDLNL